MMITAPEHQLLPATEALERAMKDFPTIEIGQSSRPCSERILTSRLDLSSSSSRPKPSFDMIDLLKATRPVEDSIAFPVIEWCTDDEDETEADSSHFANLTAELSDDEDSDFSSSMSSLGKRGRNESLNRLVRSKASSCLSSLDSVPSQLCSSFPRSSTWGQFSAEDNESCEFDFNRGLLPSKKRLCRKSVSSSSL